MPSARRRGLGSIRPNRSTLSEMVGCWQLLNRVQFETRRFQFRSSPPWATLEGWYYGFQTGRGLETPDIFTPRVAKHRFFVWASTCILPDSRVNAVARDDDTIFGIL